jgi:hypothetical protein
LFRFFRRNEGSAQLEDEEENRERVLSEEQLQLIVAGRADTTTPVNVTVTVYTTPSFRYE